MSRPVGERVPILPAPFTSPQIMSGLIRLRKVHQTLPLKVVYYHAHNNTVVKFIHEVSTNAEDIVTQKSTETSVTPSEPVASEECASDQPLSQDGIHGNIQLFHEFFVLIDQTGEQKDSPISLMLETPSIGGTRRNLTLDLNQVTTNYNSPQTVTSESSVNIDSSTNSIIARRASGLSIYLQGPREPLSDPKAARLLQHYIDHLASWVSFYKIGIWSSKLTV